MCGNAKSSQFQFHTRAGCQESVLVTAFFGLVLIVVPRRDGQETACRRAFAAGSDVSMNLVAKI
jgi:hypothetical protein